MFFFCFFSSDVIFFVPRGGVYVREFLGLTGGSVDVNCCARAEFFHGRIYDGRSCNCPVGSHITDSVIFISLSVKAKPTG